MMNIELPRAVEDYFAYAELPATERGRHFTITFTYMDEGKLDRLQWWWQVSKAQERAGEAMVAGLRDEAVRRFSQHVERWLINGNRRLTGGDPFPQLQALPASQIEAVEDQPASPPTPEEQDFSDAVRQYARMAVGR